MGIDFGKKFLFRCPAVLRGHRFKRKVSFPMPGGFTWASILAKRSFSDARWFYVGIDLSKKKLFRCPALSSGHRFWRKEAISMPSTFQQASNLAKRSNFDARHFPAGIEFGKKKLFRCPPLSSRHRIKQKVSFSMPGTFQWASILAKRSNSDALHFPAGIGFTEVTFLKVDLPHSFRHGVKHHGYCSFSRCNVII